MDDGWGRFSCRRIGFKMLLTGKNSRYDDLNQALLLPPSLHDWLPEKHLARFLADVVDALDLRPVFAVQEIQVHGIDLHVATDKQKHGETSLPGSDDPIDSKQEPSLRERMKRKLNSEAGRDLYRMRKAIVEPVFGQIKERLGGQRFFLRGLENVRAEWKLICLTHNLLKLFRSGVRVRNVLRTKRKSRARTYKIGAFRVCKACHPSRSSFSYGEPIAARCLYQRNIELLLAYSRQTPREKENE